MKFTKLIPLAMAAMLVSPAFADPPTSQSELLQITLPAFVSVTKESATGKQTASATYNDTYSTITLSQAMNAKFRVRTNYHSNVLTVHATAPLTSSGSAEALYGDAAAPKLVFTNSTTGSQPAEASVTDITGGTLSSNPNAIAFGITRTYGKEIYPEGATISENLSGTTLTLGIPNGEYTFDYTLATTAEASTFNTLDEKGTYQATIFFAWTSGT